MISVMKDICIYMIIAQAILFFIPDNAYMKYVRILVGILMIMRISEPVISLCLDETMQENMMKQTMALQEKLNRLEIDVEEGEQDMGIYNSIEEELQSRLSECKNEDYIVQKVELAYGQQGTEKSGEIEGVTVMVVPAGKADERKIEVKVNKISLTDSPKKTSEEESRLKEIYGNYLGMDTERIQIVMLQ